METVGGNSRSLLYKKDSIKLLRIQGFLLATKMLRSIVVTMDGKVLVILSAPKGLKTYRPLR